MLAWYLPHSRILSKASWDSNEQVLTFFQANQERTESTFQILGILESVLRTKGDLMETHAEPITLKSTSTDTFTSVEIDSMGLVAGFV